MKLPALLALLAPLALVGRGQDRPIHSLEEMHRLHQDPKAYRAMLEDPKRDTYQKPHEVINALGLRPGEVIADLGAGSGYFTFRLAHHLGPQGRVYAVDINPDMIRHLQRRLRDLRATNVVPLLAEPDDPLLSPKSIDRFFICDTWHHIQNRPQYLARLKEMLKPDGQVVMIDFKAEPTPVGPPLDLRISREALVKEMAAAGFKLASEHTFLPYQYFLTFNAQSPG